MYYDKARQSKTWPKLKLQNVIAFLDIEQAIHLVLDKQTMAVPVEVVGNDVLDGAGEDVAVVRESDGEQRIVVENVLQRVLSPFELSLEGLDLRLEANDFLLMFKEGEVFAFTYFFHCGRGAV